MTQKEKILINNFIGIIEEYSNEIERLTVERDNAIARAEKIEKMLNDNAAALASHNLCGFSFAKESN